jgi:hypothetical protein
MNGSPCQWDIVSNDGSSVVAMNNATGESFQGTVAAFNALINLRVSMADLVPTQVMSTQRELTPDDAYVQVTTAGSGGVETLNLTNLGGDGATSTDFNRPNGSRLLVELVAQTNPSDTVKLTTNGQTTVKAVPYFLGLNTVTKETSAACVSLPYVGAFATFVWLNQQWYLDTVACDANCDVTFRSSHITITPSDHVTGDVQSSGTVYINGGYGNDVNGGDVVLQPGGGTAAGYIKLLSLPTTDPHVADALYNNAGSLKISAG